MRYYCWMSDTCYVCSRVSNGPRYHASSRGYQPTSPCDTVATAIEAASRAQVLSTYKATLRENLRKLADLVDTIEKRAPEEE